MLNIYIELPFRNEYFDNKHSIIEFFALVIYNNLTRLGLFLLIELHLLLDSFRELL